MGLNNVEGHTKRLSKMGVRNRSEMTKKITTSHKSSWAGNKNAVLNAHDCKMQLDDQNE